MTTNPYAPPKEVGRRKGRGILEPTLVVFVLLSAMLTFASCPLATVATGMAVDAGFIPVPKGAIDHEEYPRWGVIVAFTGGLLSMASTGTLLAVVGWRYWRPRRRNS